MVAPALRGAGGLPTSPLDAAVEHRFHVEHRRAVERLEVSDVEALRLDREHLDAPDVDVLDGELLAGRSLAQELAPVVAVHHHPGDDLVALADLVLDLGPHGPQSPRSQLTVSLSPSGPCGLSGGASWLTKSGW